MQYIVIINADDIYFLVKSAGRQSGTRNCSADVIVYTGCIYIFPIVNSFKMGACHGLLMLGYIIAGGRASWRLARLVPGTVHLV